MRPKVENEQEAHVWATVYAAAIAPGEMSAEAAARAADEAVKRFRARWHEGQRTAVGSPA